MERARALLSRARNDLEPHQWEVLDRRLAAAEQAFKRFSAAAKANGQAAELVGESKVVAELGLAKAGPGVLARVGPMLMGLILLWPTGTAEPALDSRPAWADAKQEFEARLRDVSEASRQLTVELEAQPRAAKPPSRKSFAQMQLPSAVVEEDDPRCRPIPLPRHLGGNDPHNECADKMPNNSFPGGDVYVNGKNFDALQLATRTLWEVKTDAFDKHSPRSQRFFALMKLPEIQNEKGLAESCGFNFVVGVRSAAQKSELEKLDPNLNIVIMDWC